MKNYENAGPSGDFTYKSRVVRRICNTKFYQEIIVTNERFICRKGNPGGEIKIIKFANIKRDLTQEVFTDEYLKEITANHLKGNEKGQNQAIVHHIDKIDDTIMEMVISPCGNLLLLVLKKPRLELWDLRTTPNPLCIQRFNSPSHTPLTNILSPSFAGINQAFILWGQEATGEDACINIWKR